MISTFGVFSLRLMYGSVLLINNKTLVFSSFTLMQNSETCFPILHYSTARRASAIEDMVIRRLRSF